MVDKAMELRFIGGVYGGNIKPTPFICLVLKFLQIQPEKDIVVEFIRNEEFKYVRALGAFYLRLTASAVDCYKYLEPLYNDYRKLRRQNRMGEYEIVHMDEFIDELLKEERVCDVILPRLQKRYILEENGELEPKVSLLDDDLDEDMSEDEEEVKNDVKETKAANDRRRSRSQSREKRKRSKERKRSPSPLRKKYREERREKEKRRDRSRTPERAERNERSRYDDRDRDRERDSHREREKDRDRRRDRRDRSYERDRRRY
jgi:pre-mRNA-splicing factor 38A